MSTDNDYDSAPEVVYLLPAHLRDLIYGPDEIAAIAAELGFDPPLIDPESGVFKSVDLSQVRIVLSGWGMPALEAAMLHRMPSLEFVFYGAGSLKGFMRDEAWDRGIRVMSAYAGNAVPVAEFTVAQILLSLKQFWRFSRMVHERRGHPAWEVRAMAAGAFGSTVALLSLGMIGRMVAERLRAYDVKVLAYDPFASPESAAQLGVELVSLEQAFERADVVSCHTPSLPETRQMLRAKHFESMPENATFVNTARGAVVHEPELIEVLQRRKDLFAVLDVTFPEPPDPTSALYTLPNVLLTPHIAGSMNRECRRLGRIVGEELARYRSGQPLLWEISREQAARMA